MHEFGWSQRSGDCQFRGGQGHGQYVNREARTHDELRAGLNTCLRLFRVCYRARPHKRHLAVFAYHVPDHRCRVGHGHGYLENRNAARADSFHRSGRVVYGRSPHHGNDANLADPENHVLDGHRVVSCSVRSKVSACNAGCLRFHGLQHLCQRCHRSIARRGHRKRAVRCAALDRPLRIFPG